MRLLMEAARRLRLMVAWRWRRLKQLLRVQTFWKDEWLMLEGTTAQELRNIPAQLRRLQTIGWGWKLIAAGCCCWLRPPLPLHHPLHPLPPQPLQHPLHPMHPLPPPDWGDPRLRRPTSCSSLRSWARMFRSSCAVASGMSHSSFQSPINVWTLAKLSRPWHTFLSKSPPRGTR